MATVGIFGDNSNETTLMLSRLCREKGQKTVFGHYNLTENNAIPIVSIDENPIDAQQVPPGVIILQESANLNNLPESFSGYLIVNADNQIRTPSTSCGKIITFGFNGKASVTASSVADESLQVCIQRGFRTLSGNPYEPQEFKAPCPSDFSPVNVLGAVAACAICDVNLLV